MMLKFGRIAVVSTVAISLTAATIPTKAEAFGFLLAPALIGSAIIGAGSGAWGGGPYAGGPYGGGVAYGAGWDPRCGCRVWAPPPPPCCYYGGGWGGRPGGWDGGGWGGY